MISDCVSDFSIMLCIWGRFIGFSGEGMFVVCVLFLVVCEIVCCV